MLPNNQHGDIVRIIHYTQNNVADECGMPIYYCFELALKKSGSVMPEKYLDKDVLGKFCFFELALKQSDSAILTHI